MALALAGCPGSIEHPELFRGNDGGSMCPPGYNVETTLFNARCGTAGCHTVMNPAGSLDLVSPGVGRRLANVMSTCPGRVLAVPGNPATSYMIEKIGPTNPMCGSRMPLTGPPLTDMETACLRDWINALVPASSMDSGTGADAGIDAALE